MLTLNGDFADIVSYPPEKFGGIIAIQLRNRPDLIPELMKRLQFYLATYPDREHYRGILLVVDVGRIRIRK